MSQIREQLPPALPLVAHHPNHVGIELPTTTCMPGFAEVLLPEVGHLARLTFHLFFRRRRTEPSQTLSQLRQWLTLRIAGWLERGRSLGIWIDEDDRNPEPSRETNDVFGSTRFPRIPIPNR